MEYKKLGKSLRLKEKIGEGAFGEVYRGCIRKIKMDVAIKMEPVDADPQCLRFEGIVYRILWGGSEAAVKGIPITLYYKKTKHYNIIVMELLGRTLDNYCFWFTGRKFSLKTVLMLANKMIESVEYIHSRFIIHRDIKPKNFLMGKGKKYFVSLIENILFTLSILGWLEDMLTEKINIQSIKRERILQEQHVMLQLMHIQGDNKRDDLESLGYVLMFFLRGSLPWSQAINIQETKIATSIETLCEGFPQEFATYFNYVRNLKFEETPDYQYLWNLFRDLFNRSGFQLDYKYDWTEFEEETQPKPSQTVESQIVEQQPTMEQSTEKQAEQ